MKLVLNASPLIFLVKIDLIKYLPELFERIVVPEAVLNEISQHKDEVSEWMKRNKKRLKVKVSHIPSFISAWDLGRGETEVITYAYYNRDFIVALDDKAARNCAMSLHIDVTGTIGLILKARKLNLIHDAKDYLEKIQNSGFRVSNELIEYVLIQSKN